MAIALQGLKTAANKLKQPQIPFTGGPAAMGGGTIGSPSNPTGAPMKQPGYLPAGRPGPIDLPNTRAQQLAAQQAEQARQAAQAQQRMAVSQQGNYNTPAQSNPSNRNQGTGYIPTHDEMQPTGGAPTPGAGSGSQGTQGLRQAQSYQPPERNYGSADPANGGGVNPGGGAGQVYDPEQEYNDQLTADNQRVMREGQIAGQAQRANEAIARERQLAEAKNAQPTYPGAQPGAVQGLRSAADQQADDEYQRYLDRLAATQSQQDPTRPSGPAANTNTVPVNPTPSGPTQWQDPRANAAQDVILNRLKDNSSSVPNWSPTPYTVGGGTQINGDAVLNDAVWGQAKERVGGTTSAAIKALRSTLRERGIEGSGIEASGVGDILMHGMTELGDTTRTQSIDSLKRAQQVEDRNAQLGLTARGQDMSAMMDQQQLQQAEADRKQRLAEAFAGRLF